MVLHLRHFKTIQLQAPTLTWHLYLQQKVKKCLSSCPSENFQVNRRVFGINVIIYPMPTPEILRETSPRSLKQNNPWVVISGSRFWWNHRWDGLIPWMGLVLIDWTEEIPKRQRMQKISKNNLTDCGSCSHLFFAFFFFKDATGHTWANSQNPCPSTWMATPPDILNGWTCGVYHII